MTQYDNTNSGALFKNDKAGVEARPDYRGTLNVEGTEYWISSWLKTSKKGEKFMSLSVQPKDGQRAPRPETDEYDRDVPF